MFVVRSVQRFGLAIVVLAASAGWYASRADDDSRMVVIAAMHRVFSGQDPPLIQRRGRRRQRRGEAAAAEGADRLGRHPAGPRERGIVEGQDRRLLAAAQDLVDGKEGAGNRLRRGRQLPGLSRGRTGRTAIAE